MNEHRCEKCGGVYVDPQADGSRYVHHCPPPREPAPERKGLLRWVIDGLRRRR
jgi:hypothetical protein